MSLARKESSKRREQQRSLRFSDFTGQTIDDNGDTVAGVIVEQLFARHMRLAHCHR